MHYSILVLLDALQYFSVYIFQLTEEFSSAENNMVAMKESGLSLSLASMFSG